jgi:hypothetical protein
VVLFLRKTREKLPKKPLVLCRFFHETHRFLWVPWNNWDCQFLDSEGFKYPELMVLWFPRCQTPGTHGPLIPKVSNTQSWWFFDSSGFKYPGMMVLWLWKFQIPRVDDSLIPKVSNTRSRWFFDSQGFKYPELMVLWFSRFQIPRTDGSLIPNVSNTRNWWFFDSVFVFFFFKYLKPARLLQIKYLLTLEISRRDKMDLI